ncbi:hypothetical protein HDU76_010377, partial [Blyttiomyces sp. JEL0837]
MSLPSATSPAVMPDINKKHLLSPAALAKLKEFKAKMQETKMNPGVLTADKIAAWEKACKLMNMSSEDMLNMTR